MHERRAVGESEIEQLRKFRESLRESDPNRMFHVRRTVWSEAQLSHERDMDLEHDGMPVMYAESERVEFEHIPSVMELLEFIAHRPIRDQVYMVSNLLTISGFTQAEIASALGIKHQAYRNALLAIRKDFKSRT